MIGQTKQRFLYPSCVLIAAALLLVCTKSSPLYPLNDWVDTNIYFTIGKGLMRGYVPYLQLYDQKGPFVYLLYGLASLLSGTSFLGVFVLEALSFGAFLLISYRIISLYTQTPPMLLLPVLGTLILTAMSVSHGGSLEEFCLPIFAYGLFTALRYFKLDYPDRRPKLSMICINGLLAGLLLFSKFTLLSFYVAWMGILFFAQCARKDIKFGLVCCGLFVLSMLITGVPWLIYFGAHGALPEFFYYYFYTNIFGYSTIQGAGAGGIVFSILRSTLATLVRNIPYTGLIGLGALWLTFSKKSNLTVLGKTAIWAMLALLPCGLYLGGQNYRYYGLTLAAFAPLGCIPLAVWMDTHLDPWPQKRIWTRILPAALTVLGVGFSLFASSNTYLLGVPKEETPQHRFSQTMERTRKDEQITLLCRAFPDSGFYLCANVLPINRFFTSNNVMLPEVADEQVRLVDAGVPEFVITRGREDSPGVRYALLDTASLLYEGDVWTYRLYQRTAP